MLESFPIEMKYNDSIIHCLALLLMDFKSNNGIGLLKGPKCIVSIDKMHFKISLLLLKRKKGAGGGGDDSFFIEVMCCEINYRLLHPHPQVVGPIV